MERLVALAGNPNVGKSTLFNQLTGLRQHTGNWTGKTVATARGRCGEYTLVDLPGTYSLLPHSAEETVARDFLCFGGAEAVIVVCDAGCLERNLNLALQCMELHRRVLICVNLLDEAARRGIRVDCEALSVGLGVPVIGIVAREKKSREQVLRALDALMAAPEQTPFPVAYPGTLEAALERLLPLTGGERLPGRWLCLRLLEGERFTENPSLQKAAEREREWLAAQGLDRDALEDAVTAALVRTGETLAQAAVLRENTGYSDRDARIDRVLTGKRWAFPVMLLMLLGVFYLTVRGANLPSDWLFDRLFALGAVLRLALERLDAPEWLVGLLADGAYRTLAWVVAVMLPPMAIFFPLFTLLEDAGYLPRIAYNLDRPFQRCRACGKQSLCMMMGFGCNAVGVTGCRIIDSERERLLAALTNSLVPCNGRFPILIALLTMFFTWSAGTALLPALGLTLVIVFSVLASLLATGLLSATVLRGSPSAFVLELPPYRQPQIGKVLLRSVLDRTLFVLARAAAVAAPAGAVLWILANVQIGEGNLLSLGARALDPAGRFFGMDGAILLAFLLGLPANETVLPILLMIYTSGATLRELGALGDVHTLLIQNGWTGWTALCVLVFTVLHWPCSTTLLTLHKETGSWKWAGLAALLPTAMGLTLCALIAGLARLLG